MRKRRIKNIRQKNKYKSFIVTILLFLVLLYSFIYVDKKIRPAVEMLSEIEAIIVGTQAINDGITNALEVGVKYDDFLDVVKDEEGNISLIQANTVAMNMLSSNITALVQENMKSRSEQPIKIPLGNILRSQVLAHYGPNLDVEIIPIGAVQVDFFTEFEQAGINQTIHRVYVKVDTKVEVIVPLSSKSVEISTNVPIAETVIVGDVPNTYINTPGTSEEDLYYYTQ